MSTEARPIVDSLAALADAATQKTAAQMAQDIFAGTFRLTMDPGAADAGQVMSEVETRCRNWCLAGADDDARALRLALLISGLDQWGLAYSQAFKLSAIPALSALIGALRNRLDAKADARFQWFFSQIGEIESDAIDFKVELRRNMHLALWHAMAACDSDDEAQAIVQHLGSMLLALDKRMPELGWRLVADALANIQIVLLSNAALSTFAQEGTQQLFASLRGALPQQRYQEILAHSAQAVLAWQQARRPGQAG